MNSGLDSWLDFANVYDAVERNICKRSHVKLIEPLFAANKAAEIEAKFEERLGEFKMECELESEIVAAREDLWRLIDEKRKGEELERKAKEAERERIAAEKKSEEQEKKFKHDLSIKEDEIVKVKREKEQAEMMEKNFKKLHEEQMKTIALLREELSRRSSGLFDIIVPVAIAVRAAMLSDRNLKQNITTIPHSSYNGIGLDGVCWKWNEVAEKTFGLAGEGCGVIAQEVESLYPCAVTRGKDGYLLVRYDMVHEMMNNLRDTSCGRV